MTATRVNKDDEALQRLLETKFRRTHEAADVTGIHTLLVVAPPGGHGAVAIALAADPANIVRRVGTVDEALQIMTQVAFDAIVVDDESGELGAAVAVGTRARGLSVPVITVATRRNDDAWERLRQLVGGHSLIETPIAAAALRDEVDERIASRRALMEAAQRIGAEDNGPATRKKATRANQAPEAGHRGKSRISAYDLSRILIG